VKRKISFKIFSCGFSEKQKKKEMTANFFLVFIFSLPDEYE